MGNMEIFIFELLFKWNIKYLVILGNMNLLGRVECKVLDN